MTNNLLLTPLPILVWSMLQYLTLSRPDIVLYSLWKKFATKCIIWYVKGTLRTSQSHIPTIAVNVDSCICRFRLGGSTTELCVYIRPNLVSWLSKKQSIMLQSSSEVEYHAIAYTTTKIWLFSNLLCDLDARMPKTPTRITDSSPPSSWWSIYSFT